MHVPKNAHAFLRVHILNHSLATFSATNILHSPLHLLSQHQLFLKQSKCDFNASEVEYLSHIVGKDGVRVDPKKIEAMKSWPRPKNIKSMCGCLGLMGYYRIFVQNYGKIMAP